jgi:hypothetical protein
VATSPWVRRNPAAPVEGLDADRAEDGDGLLLVVGRGVFEGGSAVLEEVEAEVAALLGPLVVLFGQDGSDEWWSHRDGAGRPSADAEAK